MDAPHVYVRAWALGCFYSHISTRTFRRALTVSLVDTEMRGDKECPFSDVTKSGRVWRKVPERDTRSGGGGGGRCADDDDFLFTIIYHKKTFLKCL